MGCKSRIVAVKYLYEECFTALYLRCICYIARLISSNFERAFFVLYLSRFLPMLHHLNFAQDNRIELVVEYHILCLKGEQMVEHLERFLLRTDYPETRLFLI